MERYKTESEKQYAYMEQMKQWVMRESEKAGRPLTCHCTTFGCQMNEKDSEKLLGILETMGYHEIDSEEADFLLFNTCTVRENANTKLYGHLGQVKKMKERNPHMMIGLCGCMMQEPHVIEKIKESYPFVDIVFGTHNIFKLAELLKNRVDSGGMIVDIWKDTDQIVEDLPSDRKFSFKCGVNIMYGCNNFCSYCIVPYVQRGENITILDDTYNANPQSMRAAIRVLSDSHSSYKAAVLGDMFELGPYSPALHTEVGECLGKQNIHCLVAVGDEAKHIAEGARATGVPQVYYCRDKAEAKAVLPEIIKPDSTILVKASRGMKMEELVARLVELTPEG